MRPLNPDLLIRYLKDIYRQLSIESEGETFIHLLNFHEYTRVPILIAENFLIYSVKEMSI